MKFSNLIYKINFILMVGIPKYLISIVMWTNFIISELILMILVLILNNYLERQTVPCFIFLSRNLKGNYQFWLF